MFKYCAYHIAASLLIALALQTPVNVQATSDALYLTPYIESGKIAKAKQLSKVQLFESEVGATAHSGYITINETYGSNFFFLHIKAQTAAGKKPLLLWLQGGPGLSSLFGQFLENGPLGIDASGSLFKRESTVQKHVNVIYLDEPVGAGYSNTKNPLGYARNLDGISRDMVIFLKQFLIMFPEYENREFYVAGESYGARYAAGLAHLLQTAPDPEVPLIVKGVVGGEGFLGPLFEIADSSEFLYEVSLLTAEGKQEFEQRFQDIRELTTRNETAALLLFLQTVFTSSTNPTLFQQLTGYDVQASALYSTKPPQRSQYESYVQTSDFKKAIHVGTAAAFEANITPLEYALEEDYLTDISDRLEVLLNSCEVLFYTGQADILFPSINLQDYFRSLNWTAADAFRSAERQTWRATPNSTELSGYVFQTGNFTDVILLRAGHYAALDEAKAAYHMMVNFIEGKSFADTSS